MRNEMLNIVFTPDKGGAGSGSKLKKSDGHSPTLEEQRAEIIRKQHTSLGNIHKKLQRNRPINETEELILFTFDQSFNEATPVNDREKEVVLRNKYLQRAYSLKDRFDRSKLSKDGQEQVEIAYNILDIGPNTDAYRGNLVPGVFELLVENNVRNIETIYPSGEVVIDEAHYGGTYTELKDKLAAEGVAIQEKIRETKEILEESLNEDNRGVERVVKVSAGQLGFINRSDATWEKILERADALGLKPVKHLDAALNFLTQHPPQIWHGGQTISGANIPLENGGNFIYERRSEKPNSAECELDEHQLTIKEVYGTKEKQDPQFDYGTPSFIDFVFGFK